MCWKSCLQLSWPKLWINWAKTFTHKQFLSNSDVVEWNKTATEYLLPFLCLRNGNIFGAIYIMFFVSMTEKKVSTWNHWRWSSKAPTELLKQLGKHLKGWFIAERRHWNSAKTTFQHLETFSRQGTAVMVAKARLTVSIECVQHIKASVMRLRSPACEPPTPHIHTHQRQCDPRRSKTCREDVCVLITETSPRIRAKIQRRHGWEMPKLLCSNVDQLEMLEGMTSIH